jgi:hypothetical protein
MGSVVFQAIPSLVDTAAARALRRRLDSLDAETIPSRDPSAIRTLP